MLKTRLTVPECVARLQSVTRNPGAGWKPFHSGEVTPPLVGSINTAGFNVSRFRFGDLQHTDPTHARGRFEPGLSGTCIDLAIGIPPARLVITIVFFYGFSAAFLMLLLTFALWPSVIPRVQTHWDTSAMLTSVAIGLGLVLACALLPRGWARDREFLRKVLTDVLEAAEAAPSLP